MVELADLAVDLLCLRVSAVLVSDAIPVDESDHPGRIEVAEPKPAAPHVKPTAHPKCRDVRRCTSHELPHLRHELRSDTIVSIQDENPFASRRRVLRRPCPMRAG